MFAATFDDILRKAAKYRLRRGGVDHTYAPLQTGFAHEESPECVLLHLSITLLF
jgi:hypothetical protein